MFMMLAMFALLALSVDLGYLKVARTELQRSADAAALAGAWELVDRNAVAYGNSSPSYILEAGARSRAAQYAGLNAVTAQGPALDYQDVHVGYLANPFDPASQLDPYSSQCFPNAVQVSVRKTSELNGKVPLFFARWLGMTGSSLQAQATAALVNNVRGWHAPSSGENADLLPFALDEDTWLALVNDGIGDDDWSRDPTTGVVRPGADGSLEVNLFPEGSTELPPGNRGTVDIGGADNSTAVIARQIEDGVNSADLAAYPGGELKLDADGFLYLNGDTGISAGIKDELIKIKGKPRTIFIFRYVSGPGNNATYTIVGFAGICITDVKLTGKMSSKHVTIQPAIHIAKGAIPSDGGQRSHFVYSPVWLVR
jgi:Flp pilus assembly protein TadG